MNFQLKVTIVYDNETTSESLQADWGFACLVEVFGHTILFDTGERGDILLDNMQRLSLDPQKVKEVIISHDHHDHVGGLSDFLEVNQVPVYAPSLKQIPKKAADLRVVEDAFELYKNIYSIGVLNNIEQSLVVRLSKGCVVIVGCSHPGVGHILEKAAQFGRPIGLIGGLHGFQEYPILEALEFVCPVHCTQHTQEIRTRFPQKFITGGVGKVLEI